MCRSIYRGLVVAALLLWPIAVARAADPFAPGAAGLLNVESKPSGAAVLVDGVPVGKTPLTALSVVPGVHRVRVEAEGQTPFETDVTVVAGQAVSLLPKLAAAPTPTGAPPLATAVPPPTVAHSLLEVPVETWVAGGAAAALFGVGLGFGVAAGGIDHKAGVTYSASGVDLGLTRAAALAGQRDALAANVILIGAGVFALVGLGFAAFAPEAPVAPK